MNTNISTSGEPRRSALGVQLIFYALCSLLLIRTFVVHEPWFQTSEEYWNIALPVYVLIGAAVAWISKCALLGRSFKTKRGEYGIYNTTSSWVAGATNAVIFLIFGHLWMAQTLIKVTSQSYSSPYEVIYKHISYGKHTCSGLTMNSVAQPIDQKKICVSPAMYNDTSIGDVLTLTGIRSRFGSSVDSLTPKL
jgi:hypothetical protein